MSTESELHSAAHAAAESTTPAVPTAAAPSPAAPNPALLGLVGFLPGGHGTDDRPIQAIRCGEEIQDDGRRGWAGRACRQ